MITQVFFGLVMFGLLVAIVAGDVIEIRKRKQNLRGKV